MKAAVSKTIRAIALGIGLVLAAGGATAFAQELQSLRGPVGIDELGDQPTIFQYDVGTPQTKNFRQQPPLIPHEIDRYEIDLKVNQCLRCHDWPGNVENKAPKISETHYFDRNGVALDRVSRNRWFCNQCHVPQTNAPALVDNVFTPAQLGH